MAATPKTAASWPKLRIVNAIYASALLGCLVTPVQAGLFDDDVARKKTAELQQQNQALEARIAKLETIINNQKLLELVTQIEELTSELNKLRGEIEIHTNDIDFTRKRQKDLYVDLDTRLRRIEEGAAAAANQPTTGATPNNTAVNKPTIPAPATVTTPGSTAPTVALPADPALEGKSYDAAFNLFRSGNYQGAITSFQSFLKAYPASKMASNAQYWIGNAYSALRDYKASINNQQRLLSTYPDSPKAPDAMLNMASSQIEMGDVAGGKKTLEALIAKYPISPAAEQAKRRLSTLK